MSVRVRRAHALDRNPLSDDTPDLAIDEHGEYDPAFRPAVAAGYLTIRQAAERGERLSYASRLARRHGFSMDLAFLVADNRTRLANAIEQVAAEKNPNRDAGAGGRHWIGSAAWTLLALVVLGVGGIWLRTDDPATELSGRAASARSPVRVPVPSVQAGSEVRTNAAGSVTEVRGLDPALVLAAYCRSTQGRLRSEPVRVASAVGGHPLGIFRKGGVLLAIQIRQDETSGYWVAGNGQEPIEPARVAEDGSPLAD